MKGVTVKVVGFNKDGYRREIAVMSDRQMHSHDPRADTNSFNILDARDVGKPMVASLEIDPKNFPEMTSFVVIVQTDD